MATNYLLGREAYAYYHASDLWVLADDSDAEYKSWLAAATVVDNIMDLSFEIDSEFVDATTRGEAAQGFASEIAVLRNGRVTFDIRWKPGDTFTSTLLTAWQAGTEIPMAFMEQVYTKSNTDVSGLVANFSVSLSKTENLKDIQKASVTLAISSYPKWITVDNTA